MKLRFFNVIRGHFLWSFHNLIAHPLSEILYLIGLRKASNWLHDWSVPNHKQNEGRG